MNSKQFARPAQCLSSCTQEAKFLYCHASSMSLYLSLSKKLLFIVLTFLPQFQQKRGVGEMAKEKNAVFATLAPIL